LDGKSQNRGVHSQKDGSLTAEGIIKGFIFDSNIATKGQGGALYINQADVGISTSIFKNNQAPYGGAILVFPKGHLSVSESSFENNSAAYLYNPPSNYKDFSWIRFARTTFIGALNPFNKKPILRYVFF
jgi:hypothetical protein